MRRANVTINFFVGVLLVSILSHLSLGRRIHLYEHLPKSLQPIRFAYLLCPAERTDDSRIVGVIRGLVLLADDNGGSA